MNTLPHLLKDVDISVINSQPRLQELANGSRRKLDQKELYVFYMTLLELQKVLTATLQQQQQGSDVAAILREASDHNMELITMLFKHIVRADNGKKGLELSAKDVEGFSKHFEFLKKVFPFL